MKKKLLQIGSAVLTAAMIIPSFLFSDVKADASLSAIYDYVSTANEDGQLTAAIGYGDVHITPFIFAGDDEDDNDGPIFVLGAIVDDEAPDDRFQFVLNAADGSIIEAFTMIDEYDYNALYNPTDFSKDYAYEDKLTYEFLGEGEINFNPTSSVMIDRNDRVVNYAMLGLEYLLNGHGFSLGDFGFKKFADDETASGLIAGGGNSSSGSLGGGGTAIIIPTPDAEANKKIAVDKKNFPDDAFRAVVSIYDLDEDGFIDTNELNKLTKINLAGKKNIKNVKGIELLSWLKSIDVSNTNIEDLDLSKNVKISIVIAHDCKLKSINVENTMLADQVLTKDKFDKYYVAHDDNPSDYEDVISDEISVSYVSFLFIADKGVKINGLKIFADGSEGVGGTVVGVNTPTPTSASKPTTTPEPTKVPTVEEFAERLYTTCLGRDAEKAGKIYWASELKSGRSGAEVADGFFFSPEFVNQKLSNKEYITRLYRTFMGREPDQAGIDYWSSEMKSGKDRKFVFDGFVNSPEWANICLTYGIRSGGLSKPTFEKKASKDVKAFAERLYTTCLGRDAEPEGLEYWAQELANLRQTGTLAAQGFFFSREFEEMHLENKEFITRLYRTFMGREPDTKGFNYWVLEMKNGKSREDVFNGFATAPEFSNLCAMSGIMR